MQALEHLLVVSDGLGHAAGKTISKVVLNVELAWRSRSEEGIVETIGRSQRLADSVQLRQSARFLEAVIVGGELGDIQIEGQVLLAERLAQEFAEEQSQGRVAQDLVQAGIVGVARAANIEGRRRRRLVVLVPCNPSTYPLTSFGDGVDGMLRRLEIYKAGVLLRHRAVLLHGGNQTVLDEEMRNQASFPTVVRCGAIHQPVDRGFAGEGVVVDLVSDSTLLGHLDANEAGGVFTDRVRVRARDAGLDVGSILAGEAAEDDLDGGSIRGQLIRLGIAFEVDELHGVARRVQHVHDVAGRDAIALAEALKDVDALAGQLVQAALHRKVRGIATIDGLDEAGVDEALADGAGHLLGHGEGGRGGGGDDAAGILGIRHAIRLGEFERPQVVDGLFGGEGVLEFGEADTVGVQLQADHEGRKEVIEILGTHAVRIILGKFSPLHDHIPW